MPSTAANLNLRVVIGAGARDAARTRLEGARCCDARITLDRVDCACVGAVGGCVGLAIGAVVLLGLVGYCCYHFGLRKRAVSTHVSVRIDSSDVFAGEYEAYAELQDTGTGTPKPRRVASSKSNDGRLLPN